MIIYTNQRSKKRKPNAKQRELAASWNKLVESTKPKISRNSSNNNKIPTYSHPPGREGEHHGSYDSGHYDTFKKLDKKYTGEAMVGIATMHKSNIVPIFDSSAAKDVARMRR